MTSATWDGHPESLRRLLYLFHSWKCKRQNQAFSYFIFYLRCLVSDIPSRSYTILSCNDSGIFPFLKKFVSIHRSFSSYTMPSFHFCKSIRNYSGLKTKMLKVEFFITYTSIRLAAHKLFRILSQSWQKAKKDIFHNTAIN